MVGMGHQENYAARVGPAKLHWFTAKGLSYLVMRSMWRFWVTGVELRGRGDNATWLHDATVDYRQRPYEKLSRARWRRVATRWAVAGVPMALAIVGALAEMAQLSGTTAWWVTVPWFHVMIGWPLAVVFVLSCMFLANVRIWLETRSARRDLVIPAAQVLCRLVGVSVSRRHMTDLVVLPPGFTASPEPGATPDPVRVTMPGNVPLPESLKDRIAQQVGARLGMPHPTAAWTDIGRLPYVDLLPAPLPPNEVRLASIYEALEATTLECPIVGVAQGNRVVHMDMENDSPHTLGSAGSGAGKSTLYKFVAMQRMRHGAGAIFLDFKKWSHLRWLRGIGPDRVLMFYEIQDMHNALCAINGELMRRRSIDDENELAELRTLDIYVEELNSLMQQLTDYWTEHTAREKSGARSKLRQAKVAEDEMAIAEAEEELAVASGLPKTSPAVQALRYGVNLGREFRVHWHVIGQSVSARAAGGRDTRESFRTRLLARWDRKTWRMLADGIRFRVCPGGPVGLWAHVHGSEVDIVRVPWVTDTEAREYVMSGPPVSGHILSADIGGTVSAPSPDTPKIMSGDVRTSVLSVAPLSEIMSVLPDRPDGTRMTLKALQLASGRTGFPAPVDKPGVGRASLYDTGDVLAWFTERHRRGIAR